MSVAMATLSDAVLTHIADFEPLPMRCLSRSMRAKVDQILEKMTTPQKRRMYDNVRAILTRKTNALHCKLDRADLEFKILRMACMQKRMQESEERIGDGTYVTKGCPDCDSSFTIFIESRM